jgi:hemerythrin
MDEPKSDRIISDQEAQRTMTELIKRVNQHFFGRNKSKYMTGIGHIDYQTCGQPHYHWLINTSISAKELEKAVDYIVNRALKSFKKGKKQKLLSLMAETLKLCVINTRSISQW